MKKTTWWVLVVPPHQEGSGVPAPHLCYGYTLACKQRHSHTAQPERKCILKSDQKILPLTSLKGLRNVSIYVHCTTSHNNICQSIQFYDLNKAVLHRYYLLETVPKRILLKLSDRSRLQSYRQMLLSYYHKMCLCFLLSNPVISDGSSQKKLSPSESES